VVHSHTGTLQEALELIDMGFYIGINGCSLKTEENLAVVKQLPLEK
jgi:TatD DNase family protein